MKELEGPLSDCFLGSLGEPTDHREYRDNDDKGIIPSARGRKLQNDRPRWTLDALEMISAVLFGKRRFLVQLDFSFMHFVWHASAVL